MCGRYMFQPETNSEILRIYQLAKAAGYEPKTGEIFPTDQTALIVAGQKQVQVVAMKWGFPGFKKGQTLINARAETVQEKEMFAQPFAQHRCVYPTTGFFEWTKQKQQFRFNYTDEQQPLYIAGFYDSFGGVNQSILLTTAPNAAVAPIHDRMPLILAKNQINRWIYQPDFAQKFLRAQMPQLQAESWPK